MNLHSLGEFEELVRSAQHGEAYGVTKGFIKSRFGGITEERRCRRKQFYVITSLGTQGRNL